MGNVERILDFLGSHPKDRYDDDQLSELLDIRPRQTINQICRRLASEGRIRRELVGGKIRNWVGTVEGQSVCSPATMPEVGYQHGHGTTPARFQETAGLALGKHFGVRLLPGTVSGVPKRFDYVSPSGDIIGDAKYFTLVRGVSLPPAKFSVIAEHVWLLEKTSARRKFLVFGNDRRVPLEWLKRFGHLAEGVEFYFMSRDSSLELLNRGRKAF